MNGYESRSISVSGKAKDFLRDILRSRLAMSQKIVQTNSRKHHITPRMILKNFSIDNKNEEISIFPKTERLIKSKNYDKVCRVKITEENIFYRNNLMKFEEDGKIDNLEDNNQEETKVIKKILDFITQQKAVEISLEDKAALASFVYSILLKKTILELKSSRSPFFLFEKDYCYFNDLTISAPPPFYFFKKKYLGAGLDSRYNYNRMIFATKFLFNTSLNIIVLNNHSTFVVGDRPIILGKRVMQDLENINQETILNVLYTDFTEKQNLRLFGYSLDLNPDNFDSHHGYGAIPLSKHVLLTWEVKEEQKNFNGSDRQNIKVKHIVDEKFLINFNFLMYLFSYKGVAVGNDKARSDLMRCILDTRTEECHIALYEAHLKFENVLKNI